MSAYNGIAPGSKLAFFGQFDGEAMCLVCMPGGLMDMVTSTVASNSWVFNGSFPYTVSHIRW